MNKIIKLITSLVILFFISNSTLKADHIWGARNLVATPAGGGLFDIEYEYYRRNGWTSNWFYWELFVVEEGCPASDGFTASFSDCTDTNAGVNLAWNDGVLATDLAFCPGKTYNIILYTRRRGNEGGPPCGSNENRASAASPLGELIKFPTVGAGDPANIWTGAPQNNLGDTPTFDGNWAYLSTSLVIPGTRPYQIMAEFDVDDCEGSFDQTVDYNNMDDGFSVNTSLPTATVLCGSELVVTYNSDNSCGPGFPGNTYEISNESTIAGFDPSSGNLNSAMGAGLNVDGRFEILTNAMASGNTCSSGIVGFEFMDADCNAETDISVMVDFEVIVLTPTSEFATPTTINCSDACGQELLLSGSDPQWRNGAINTGNTTTLPNTDAPNTTYSFTGQICTPDLNAVSCNSGSGSVTVDQCASCGIYDITYEIANSDCTECSTTTTKQVQIVSPVITTVASDETSFCGTFTPILTFEVKACNPADGSATAVDYTGAGTKFWTRNDMPGTLIPEGDPMLEVLEGTTIIFTPTFVNDNCADCSATGTPITVASFSDADDPTNGNTTVEICEGETTTLMATCNTCDDSSTPTVEWYSNASGGTSIYTGASFTPTSGSSVAQQGVFNNMTPGLYTFFAECVCNGCPSNRAPYTVEIIDSPVTPSPVTIDFTCNTNTTGLVAISALFAGADLTPANFTSNAANPSNIQGGAVVYDEPGCYCVDYNFDNGVCPAIGPITSCVIVSEQPQPSFNVQSPVCFSTVGPAITANPIVTSPSYISPVDRVWTATGPATIDATSGMVTFTGTGTVMVTMTETIDYSACGTVAAGSCTNQVTQSISVESGDNLDPSFTVSNTEPCLNEVVTLTPTENGGVFSGDNVVDNGDGTGGTFTPTSCGPTEITYTRFSSNGCENTLITTINTDQTPPTLTVPPNTTVNCDGTGNATDITAFEAMFSASDNCSISSSSLTELSNINTCGNTSVITYQYTATDPCNNTTTEYATLTIEDTTAPVITPASTSPTIVDCDGNGNSADIQAWLNSNGGLTNADVTEMCSTFIFDFTFSGISVEDPLCTGNIKETYTAEFTAVDECGNISAPVTRTLQIRDNANPTITPPSNITLECNADNNDAILQNFLSSVFSTDICDGDVTITNDYTALPDCGMTSTVTFTAVDDCNNMVTATALITVEDTQNPIVTLAPTDLVLECDGTADPGGAIAAWLLVNGNGVFEDSCDPNPLVTATAGTTTILCPGSTITPYTFTVTDDCGNNSVNEVANVIIQDNTAPSLAIAADPGPIACQGANPFLWAGAMAATANDACSNVTVTNTLVSVVEDGCAGKSIYTFSFTATDECGNSVTSPGTYTTTDNIGPVFTIMPTNITVACGDNITGLINTFLNTPVAEDGCGGAVSLTHDYDGSSPDLCGDDISVTFTATDECGNSTTASANITVVPETTPPMFDNCPADMFVNIDGTACTTATVFFPTPTSSDCNIPVTITQTAGLSSGSDFPIGTTGVTFIATDACNNIIACNFNVTVVDNAAPNITCPNDLVICNDEGACAWTSTSAINPLFTDGCATSTTYTVVTPSGTSTGIGSAAGEILDFGVNTITYVVDDGNGNTASCMFTVTVEDCEDPEILCPADLILECQIDDEATEISNWLASIIGKDNCDTDLDFTTAQLLEIAECGQTSTRQFQFTATDDAGNESVCFANVIIEDTTAPVLADNAPDITVECDGNGNGSDLADWLASNSGILASDVMEDCGPASDFINDYNVGNFIPNASCPSTGYYDVQYTAKDQCDNISNSITVRFTIEDTTAPTITAPSDITLSCNEESNEINIIEWLSLAHAEDVCSDDLNITNDYFAPNLPGCEAGMNMLTVTFTVTDDCGLTATATSTITIVDNDKPIIMTPPADLVLECPAMTADIMAWTDNFGAMTVFDKCDDDVTLSFTVGTPVGLCGNTQETPYTFTATDDCGNSISEIAYLRTIDTTPPVLTLPDETSSVQCTASVNARLNDWLNSAIATDECGNVTITYALISIQEICTGSNVTRIDYTYLFTATDQCGNISTGQDIFRVRDSVAPEITPPSDISLQCGDDISLNVLDWLDNYTVIEACQTTTVTNSFDASLVDLCGSTTLVTWTVTDECGASGTATANIIIQADVLPPVFLNCPTQDIIVNVNTADCQARVNYPTPVATDCNTPVTVTPAMTNIASGGIFPLGTSTISFEAEDACGNTATCSFDIIVEDNDTPTLACPSDVTLCTDDGSCTFEATTVLDPFFNENCTGATLTYTIVNDGTTTNSPATGFNTVSGQSETLEIGTSLITYTTTDAAGNMATCSFSVTVEDCEAPVLACPSDITLECGDPNIEATLVAFESAASFIPGSCQNSADPDCIIDFTGASFLNVTGQSFGSHSLSPDGTEITLNDNHWVGIDLPFTIGTSTFLEFQFLSPAQQEVQGIGFGNGNGLLPSNQFFQLWGTQNFSSNTDYMYTTPGAWQTFIIPVGTFYTGTFNRLILGHDADSTPASNSQFRNIKVYNAGASVTDNCDMNVTTSSTVFSVDTQCGMTSVSTYIFTATDDAGNTSTCLSTVTIEDTTPPTIVAGTAGAAECDGSGNTTELLTWVQNNGGATATDECGTVTWTNDFAGITAACAETGAATVTFTATDECGLSSTTMGTFTITDTAPPSITAPSAITLECGAESNPAIINNWLNGYTANDGCGDVTVTNDFTASPTMCEAGMNLVTVTWTVTDECGMSATTTSTITIVDNTKPTIMTPPSDLIVDCPQAQGLINAWTTTFGGLTAIDNCDIPVLSFSAGTPVPGCGNNMTTPYTFTATDACGNSISEVAYLISQDTIDPILTLPTVGTSTNCSANPITLITPWLSEVSATDNCDNSPLITYNLNTEGTECSGTNTVTTFTYIFTATDECGNQSTGTSTYTITDDIAPAITAPANLEVACGDNIATMITDWLDNYSITEVCQDYTVSNNYAGTVPSLCGGMETVTWTVIDGCGAMSTATSMIIVTDDITPPTFSNIIPSGNNNCSIRSRRCLW